MLTYDDLDHFDERTLAGLFDPAVLARERAETERRRERILACLHFCRDIPSDQLPADGILTARKLLQRALRRQRRELQPAAGQVADVLEAALAVLGEPGRDSGEPIEAVVLRHAVERKMEAAARTRSRTGTVMPRLLEALARGDFEIGAGSKVASLAEASRKFNGSAEVDIELRLDGGGFDAAAPVRVRLAIACGWWRWSPRPGCSVALEGHGALSLDLGDELLPVMLAGLSVQGGRAITRWSAAVGLAATRE